MGTIVKLNAAIAALITTALSMGLDALIAAVSKSPIAKAGLESVKNRLIQTTSALADADPNDTEQLEKIWLKQFVGEDVYEIGAEQFQAGLAKIQSERLKRLAAHIGRYGLEVVKLVTDDDPNNEAQLREHLAKFFEDAETEAIIVEDYVRAGLTAAAAGIRNGGDANG
jgi:hypothetical protein